MDRTHAERLLLCDHLPSVRAAMAEALRVRGWVVVEVGSVAEIREALSAGRFEVVVVDPAAAPEVEARHLTSRVAEWQPDLDVVVMTHLSDGAAAAAMVGGATDYLERPVCLRELEFRLTRLRREREDRREAQRLRGILYGDRLRDLLVDSPSMREVWERIRLFADQTGPVLVAGERGTGKRLVAATIHEIGPRRSGPFVTVRCLDSPRDLPARLPRAFGDARGGTLLLHNVHGLSDLSLQERLVRFLDVGTIQTARPDEGRHAVDVRIVATTAIELPDAVEAGRVRPDLWDRLRPLQIHLPALRWRGEDTLALARGFLRGRAELAHEPPKHLSPEVATALRRYAWPGNVTELRQVIGEAAVAARGGEVGVNDLPAHLSDPHAARRPFQLHLDSRLPAALPELTERLERDAVKWALDRWQGDRRRAAEVLGVPLAVVERLCAWSGPQAHGAPDPHPAVPCCRSRVGRSRRSERKGGTHGRGKARFIKSEPTCSCSGIARCRRPFLRSVPGQ